MKMLRRQKLLFVTAGMGGICVRRRYVERFLEEEQAR